MNIPSTTSSEAFYILECENNYSEKQNNKFNMDEGLNGIGTIANIYSFSNGGYFKEEDIIEEKNNINDFMNEKALIAAHSNRYGTIENDNGISDFEIYNFNDTETSISECLKNNWWEISIKHNFLGFLGINANITNSDRELASEIVKELGKPDKIYISQYSDEAINQYKEEYS